MKNNITTQAALLGVIATATLVLSVRSHVGVDSIVGFGSILGLLGVAAMEYGITWKRALGR